MELFKRVSDFLTIIENKTAGRINLKVKETMTFMQEYVIVHLMTKKFTRN